MDIFELAMAKKLFGGGGGKREGTAVPVGQPVERIFFNLANTQAETNAILSQLTYVQTPLLQYPLYAVYANTEDGNAGSFVVVLKLDENSYAISHIGNITSAISGALFNGKEADKGVTYNGWQDGMISNTPDISQVVICGAAPMYQGGYCLTDFNGIPVGAENEKIKDVLSITPYFTATPKPAVEGTAIPVGKWLDVIYFNFKNTKEETDALLSQLTYVQTDLLSYPVYPIFYDEGTAIFVAKTDDGYAIHFSEDITSGRSVLLYYSASNYVAGWEIGLLGNALGCLPAAIAYRFGTGATDFMGLPVGTENEKIKNVLSITPF